MGRLSAAKKRLSERNKAAVAARWHGEKENIPTTRSASRTVETLQEDAKRNRQSYSKLLEKYRRVKQSAQEANKRADVAEKMYANAKHLAGARLRELKVLRATEADQKEQLAKHDALQNQVERLKKAKKALQMRLKRATASHHRALAKAINKSTAGKRTIRMKHKGVVPENIRRISRGLMATCGVSAVKVAAAIGVFARGLGMTIEGSFSARTAGRALREGGVGARLQIAEATKNAKSVTLSHDGMAHKNRNYTAQNMHVVETDGGIRKYFCGLVTTTDHTSETGANNWKLFLEGLIKLWNSTPLGTSAPLFLVQLTRLIRGVNSDHAANERATARLIHEWCQATDREARGKEKLVSLPPPALLAILCLRLPKRIDAMGGPAIYQLLSARERQDVFDNMYRELALEVGQKAFDELPAAFKRAIDLFVWCGCCMHKDLNATKAGNTALMAYWSSNGVTGPAKLMNKAQTSAAASSDSEAALRSELAAGAGGVKVAMLCGLLFRNKSDKLGQQDSFKIFFESRLGRILAYPDTSNTRFQSYLNAAGFLLCHRQDVLKFMEQVRQTKDKSSEFTNLEKNIVLGLSDIPTLTELAAIALYAEAISYPYMRQIRGSKREHDNALRLGPLHARVIAHCRAIILDPDLLLSPTAPSDPSKGALDGKQWEHPEVMYAVHQRLGDFPHIRGALVAFFEGAVDAWVRFSAEYETGGAIDSLSEQERDEIFLPSTNDACEGAVGDGRQDMRRNGNITMLTHNAKSMMRLNGTEQFLETAGDDLLKAIRATARAEEALGLAKAERQAHAEHKEKVQHERSEKEKARKTANDARNAVLDGLELRLDVSDLRAHPGTRAQLDQQLDWHRRWHLARCGKKCPDDHQIPLKSHITKLQDKLDALIGAVEFYCSATAASQEASTVTEDASKIAPQAQDDFLASEMAVDDSVMYG